MVSLSVLRMAKWLPRLSGLSPADGKTQGYPWRASRRVTPGREKEKDSPLGPRLEVQELVHPSLGTWLVCKLGLAGRSEHLA